MTRQSLQANVGNERTGRTIPPMGSKYAVERMKPLIQAHDHGSGKPCFCKRGKDESLCHLYQALNVKVQLKVEKK